MGVGSGREEDPTARAVTPFFDRAYRLYPHAVLEASGPAIGLPEGEAGSSDIGHRTLGAGRVLEPERIRIQRGLDGGELERNPVFGRLLSAAAHGSGRLHLLGEISDRGVHSSLAHLEAILEAVARSGVTPIVHGFTGGRALPPRTHARISALEDRLRHAGGAIATLCGRNYAMDRDRRWERIAQAYRAIVLGQGHEFSTALDAIEGARSRGETEEFLQPSVIVGTPTIQDGEAALCFNFRADRALELAHALARVRPERLGREVRDLPSIRLSELVTWTVYDRVLDLPAVFDRVELSGSIGELLGRSGLRQLRVAETENRAAVTCSFSGGREEPFPGEDRILVPSPKEVPSYELEPEMSAVELTDRLLDALAREDYAFAVVSYANADRVGHTGVMEAAVRVVEVLDACLDRVTAWVLGRGGTLLITADHGNLERMADTVTGSPHTAHTSGAVPLLWVIDPVEGRAIVGGGLADVAPSLCLLLGLEVPEEMTGRCLLVGDPLFSS